MRSLPKESSSKTLAAALSVDPLTSSADDGGTAGSALSSGSCRPRAKAFFFQSDFELPAMMNNIENISKLNAKLLGSPKRPGTAGSHGSSKSHRATTSSHNNAVNLSSSSKSVHSGGGGPGANAGAGTYGDAARNMDCATAAMSLNSLATSSNVAPTSWRRVAASPGINGRLVASSPSMSMTQTQSRFLPPPPPPSIFSHSPAWASTSKPRVDTKWDKTNPVAQHYGFGGFGFGCEGEGEGEVRADADDCKIERKIATASLELSGECWDRVQEALALSMSVSSSFSPSLTTRLDSPLWLSLRFLTLINCDVKPAYLACLPKLPHLESFDVSENAALGEGGLCGLGGDDISVHVITQLLAAGESSSSFYSAQARALCWLDFAPRVRKVVFRGCGLTTVPSLLGLLVKSNRPALEHLDLSHNHIVNPEGLEIVSGSLTTLNLSHNAVVEFGPCGVRLLGCLGRLNALLLAPNPVLSGPSPSAYRAAIIDILPALSSLDGAATPPSALKVRLAREAVTVRDAAAKAAAAALRSRRVMHVYGQGTGLLAASRLHAAAAATPDFASPPRPPPRANSIALASQRASSSKLAQPVRHTERPFGLLEEDRIVEEQAKRTLELRDRVSAREVAAAAEARAVYASFKHSRRSPLPVPATPVDVVSVGDDDNNSDLGGVFATVSAEVPFVASAAASAIASPLPPAPAPSPLLAFNAWSARQEIIALSHLSALKALLQQRPWVLTLVSSTNTLDAINAAAQASASATATVLGRLEGLLGEPLGLCDVGAIARRAAEDQSPPLRGLLAAEVREALLGGASARALKDLDWITVADSARAQVVEIGEITATARAALRIKAHALLSHALALRRLTQAASLLGGAQTDQMALIAVRAADQAALYFITEELPTSAVAHLCGGMK